MVQIGGLGRIGHVGAASQHGVGRLGEEERLLAIGIAVGGYALYRAATKPAEFTYRTVKVERGRIAARVTATGTLSALVTVQVGSQVSGRIAQIFVDFNSTVKKGQVIAKLDPALFEAAVASARANMYAAQGNVDQARAKAQIERFNIDGSKITDEKKPADPAAKPADKK